MRALRILSQSNVDFIVVGGAAIALHGIPRTTLDIDIYVESTPNSVKTIFGILVDKEGLICQQNSMRTMADKAYLIEGQWMTFSISNGPDSKPSIKGKDIELGKPHLMASIKESD